MFNEILIKEKYSSSSKIENNLLTFGEKYFFLQFDNIDYVLQGLIMFKNMRKIIILELLYIRCQI